MDSSGYARAMDNFVKVVGVCFVLIIFAVALISSAITYGLSRPPTQAEIEKAHRRAAVIESLTPEQLDALGITE